MDFGNFKQIAVEKNSLSLLDFVAQISLTNFSSTVRHHFTHLSAFQLG